jgi:hypothetical protein
MSLLCTGLTIVLAFIGGMMVGGLLGVTVVCLLIKGRQREESLQAWERFRS